MSGVAQGNLGMWGRSVEGISREDCNGSGASPVIKCPQIALAYLTRIQAQKERHTPAFQGFFIPLMNTSK